LQPACIPAPAVTTHMGVRVELTSILLTLLLAYVNAIPLVLPTGQKVQGASLCAQIPLPIRLAGH